jgi:hypothetical protein
MDVENGRSGILADGRGIGSRQLHVLQYGLQGAARRRAGLFPLHGLAQLRFHIRRQAAGRQTDQLKDLIG